MKQTKKTIDQTLTGMSDNLTVSRLLTQLIHRYLHEEDDIKRREIFAGITSLRNLTAVINKGRRY